MNIYELSFQRKTAAWQPAVDAGVFHCVFFTDKPLLTARPIAHFLSS